MNRTAFGTAVGALACAGLMVGCSFSVGGGTPLVAKADLQSDISKRLDEAGIKAESVNCPEDLVGEMGKTTRCDVVISADNSLEPVVTVTKVEGTDVSYELTPAVSKEQLQKKVTSLLAEASGEKVDAVVCDTGLEGTQGYETHCTMNVGGAPMRRTVEVTGVKGFLLDFNLVPVMPKAALQDSLLDQLAEQLGERPATADCTSDLDGKPGSTVECKVVLGGSTRDFVLTTSSVDGDRINYSYESKG